MGRFHWKTGSAIAAGAAAAILLGTAPAQAYKLDDGKLEVKGLVFADFVQVDGNASSTTDDNMSGFHVSRAYFEMRGHPESDTTIRITLDTKGLREDEGGDVFLKYAYVERAVGGGAKVKFGLGHTPLVDYHQTHIWGHRYVAKTFSDDVGALSSSDLGVSVAGKAGDMFSYHLSIMNGEGYNHSDHNGKGLAYSGRVEAKAGPVRVGAFAHTETDHAGQANHDPNRQDVYASFDGDWGNVAAEFLAADDGTGGSKFDSGTGYSALANLNLPMGNKSQAFVRYDSMEYKTSDADPHTLIIVGAETEASKGVTLALDYQIRDDGTDSVSTAGIHAQFKI